MEVNTTRFGPVAIEREDLIQFPSGLPGLEDCQAWVLLADAHNEALGWLQSTSHPEVAMAVVSPRRFVPGYQLRVSSSELSPLALDDVREAQVLVIVGKHDDEITLNLKAPVVINLERSVGRQVINNADEPIAFVLESARTMKKSA